MHRVLTRSLILMVAPMLAVAVHAGPASPPAGADEPKQGFIVAVPPISSATAANKVADEPQALPSTQVQVQAYRDDVAPCDRRQGTGQEACRAQVAAKYAEMDKLCRATSAAEFPTCIKSAYAAD
jgi:hypothetical protein